MKKRARIGLFILAFILALLIGHHNATAGNWQSSQLDTIASGIAQKPISVWCEDDSHVWDATESLYGKRFSGYTFLTAPVIYISPPLCETLHAIVVGEDVGTYWAAHAILALTHESTHQRLNSPDEALVECTAMKLLPTVLQQQFQIPPTFTYVTSRTVTKRVHGKRTIRRIRSTHTTPNVYYDNLLRDAARWDAILPPAYHNGTC